MTMLRLSLVALFLSILTHQTASQPCNSCGGSNIQKDRSTTKKINAGVEKISCHNLLEIAAQRKAFTDVCWIVQGYAHKYCDCRDKNNKVATPLPYKKSTAYCNLCDGNGGSDLHTISPSREDTLVNSGVSGFRATCGDLYKFGTVQQAFTKNQCPTLQKNTMDKCGCALRDVNGKKIRSVSDTQCVGANRRCENATCCSGNTCVKFGKNGPSYCVKVNRNLRGEDVGEMTEEEFFFDEEVGIEE